MFESAVNGLIIIEKEKHAKTLNLELINAVLLQQTARAWRPQHIDYYNVTTVVDCDGEVAESNEGDNILVISNYEVTITGDINSDHSGVIDIMDAV